MKKSRGCEQEVLGNEFEFDGESLRRCPLRLVTKQSMDYIRFHNYMEKGFLPNDGSILNQPNKFLEANDVIDSALAKMDEEKRNKK